MLDDTKCAGHTDFDKSDCVCHLTFWGVTDL